VSDPLWLNEAEHHAWRAFLDMQRRLFAHLIRLQQRDFGLSAADYEILVNLSEAPTGRMRAFELSESTLWEKSRLSHHLKRMEQRGLVRREPTDNVRSPDFMQTEAGREAIAAAAPAQVVNVRAWFIDPLGPERLARFAEDCEAICAALDVYEQAGCEPTAGDRLAMSDERRMTSNAGLSGGRTVPPKPPG
jgi:DNA-binding MarR family transcriptional regulator